MAATRWHRGPALVRWLIIALALHWLTLAPASAMAGGAAGEVVFAIGEVTVSQGERERSPERGDPIRVGDRIVTGSGGNVHIRFRDGAFLSLKPESAVRVEVYDYDPEHPEDSRVRLVHEQGVTRNTTGDAGERNRGGYRLNTPVAAIGVRGTDFATYANDERTRVSVHEGGVAVSPFNEDCLREGFGACAGDGVRELFAGDQEDALLEVKRGDAAARVVEADNGVAPGDAPDGTGERQPEEEGSVGSDEPPADGINTDDEDTGINEEASPGDGLPPDGQEAVSDRGSGAPEPEGEEGSRPDSDRDRIAEDSAEEISERRNAGEVEERAREEAERRERYQAVRGNITWGRWSRFAEDDSVIDVRRDDQAMMAANGVFGLMAPREWTRPGVSLPDQGVVAFNMGDSQAFIRDGEALSGAEVLDPELTVDFNRRKFDTRFDVDSAALGERVRVAADGPVRDDGGFRRATKGGKTVVSGVVSPGGDQAGMLFTRKLDDGREAVGAIDWFR
ncbi:FecR domain-containing protein [Arhodomonas sp. SL1]|uniref:FecR family protein n=1 Tax=Arhodomonas sp. SL1 TaxID=3425691 RepID=UPI003F88390D